MNTEQARRNALSQRIVDALENTCCTSAELLETANVASILWRSSGESEYGFRPAELVGLPQRIRKVAETLDITVTDAEIAACNLGND